MHNPAIPLLRLIERLIGRLLSREAVWQCGSEAVWLLIREAVWRLIQSDPVPLWLRGDDAISLILSDIIRFQGQVGWGTLNFSNYFELIQSRYFQIVRNNFPFCHIALNTSSDILRFSHILTHCCVNTFSQIFPSATSNWSFLSIFFLIISSMQEVLLDLEMINIEIQISTLNGVIIWKWATN